MAHCLLRREEILITGFGWVQFFVTGWLVLVIVQEFVDEVVAVSPRANQVIED